MLNTKNKALLALGMSFGLFFSQKGIEAQTEISLNTISWRWIKQDGANFAFKDMNDESWSPVSARSPIYAGDADALWLRSKVFISATSERLAFLLEKICGKHQVYLNGKLLPQKDFEKVSYSYCPRYALHFIPLSLLNTETGESTIAIRLIRSSSIPYLSLGGKIAILPFYKAEHYLWAGYLWGLIFGFLSLILSLFFLAMYLRLYRTREYYLFSLFLFVYALYKFTQNEMLYSLTGFAPLYEHLAQFCFMVLPALFYIFYVSFFQMKNFRFSLGNFRIEKDAEKLGNSYLLLSIVFGLISSISPNLSKYFKVNFIWISLQAPVLIYYLSAAIQNARLSLRESSSFLVGIALLCFVFLYNFLTSKEDILWDPKGGGGIFLLQLSISIGLLYILIQRKVEVEKHNKYLKSIDELQHRIFGYIGSMLAKPTEQVLHLIRKLGEKKKFSEDASQIKGNIKEIQSNLDNLMQLARLEVLSEPEHVDEINLHDFTQVVFANAKLNSYIRVDPGTTIETALDLMNSSMLYLLDFLNQQEFHNIDLVITSQANSNILFHFLAFHTERRKVKEVYSVCSHITPLRDPRWIKWSIISEIIRVMKGKIFINRVRGRFLRVSITLPRSLRLKETFSALEKVKEKQKVISLSHSDNDGESSVEGEIQKQALSFAGKEEDARNNAKESLANIPPDFHANMSLGELCALLKFKIMQRKKR